MDREGKIKRLKEVLEKEVFITNDKERIYLAGGGRGYWLFDLRRVLLRAEILDDIGEIFWEQFQEEEAFQVGGVEAAAIPLITAVVLKSQGKAKMVNGFFMRKSRKKDWLARMIEGTLTDEKIILIDDIINSGGSLIRQVEILEGLGKKVDAVFVILRFRDAEFYEYFHQRGIKIISIFTLNDFSQTLGLKNLVNKNEPPVPMLFKAEWLFKSKDPNYYYVVPKSAPIIDEKRIYFGSDSGNFWALNQIDGSVAWKYTVGFHAHGKYIFSSPALYKNSVYFGAYDGNFYALDKETGRRLWIFMEADWIGSSPCIAPDLGLVFVGLEFGLWKKNGGVVALDAVTGKKKWEYFLPELVHCSPQYSPAYKILVIGGNDGSVSAFNAKSGKLLWQFKTGGEVKASFAFDEERGLVAFGSFDSYAYVLRVKTGELVYKIKTNEAIYSTPLIYKDFLYIASLDKNLYCIDLKTGKVSWKFQTNGRIFASPERINDKFYIGSNDGRLYELDAITGKNTAFFQATERITNKIAYNKITGRIFLLTFANEMYCLTKEV